MGSAATNLSDILRVLARQSTRPRYVFMVLNLIMEAAGDNGRVGPYVVRGNENVPVRDWLCDALAPMAERAPRRQRMTAQVEEQLREQLPEDPEQAQHMLESALRDRVRASGRSNVSRAVSELVRSGLVKRHYQGWRTNHHNRGAGREAVYTVTPDTLAALRRRTHLV